MPLDTLITGRIATLAGDIGFGWVEAVGIRDGRIAFAGSEVELETRADPFTRRLRLEPDQVAIPGLTDAHLHLAQAALATRQIDLTGAATLADGLAAIRAAHDARPDPAIWLEGHGWDSDRWGGWPTADDLETVAPGRRVAIWAHDHHALWASHAALAVGGFGADDPTRRRRSARSRRLARGRPVRERDPARDHPRPAAELRRPRRGHRAGRARARLARRRRLPRPGRRRPRPDLTYAYPVYARLADAGDLPVRVHACMRDDAVATAIARGHRSGAVLGEDPDGWARVGWQKCFADGSLGSRTAALLEDIEPEPDRPLAAGSPPRACG